MTDILDNLSDLDDDLDSEIVLADDDENTLVLDDIDEMTEDEATEITAAIRSTVTATYVLLYRAHEGKAYKALGYDTWKEYVAEEFDFSTQRSYQLLDLAKTVEVIESVAPEGTALSLTESQARDIKRELPKITERVQEETAGKSPEEASDIVDDIVDETRQQQKDDAKALKDKEEANEEREKQEESDRLEAQADSLLEPDEDVKLGDSASGDYADFSVEGEGSELSQRDTMALFNFFNILTGFESLPDPHEMIKLIPQEREDQVEKSLLEITGWFNSFHTIWDDREVED